MTGEYHSQSFLVSRLVMNVVALPLQPSLPSLQILGASSCRLLLLEGWSGRTAQFMCELPSEFQDLEMPVERALGWSVGKRASADVVLPVANWGPPEIQYALCSVRASFWMGLDHSRALCIASKSQQVLLGALRFFLRLGLTLGPCSPAVSGSRRL